MNKSFWLWIGLLAFGLALGSCKRDLNVISGDTINTAVTTDGLWRIYLAEDTNYATATGVEGRTFFKREEYDGTEIDLLGREVAKLFIYESPANYDSTGNELYDFTYSDLWTAYIDDDYFEVQEGNIRYLYMKLPPYEGVKWNGNLLNNEPVQTYTYLSVDTTITVNDITFEHCVYVEEVPYDERGSIAPSGFYIREHAYQIYAPYVGKIVRHRERVSYQGLTLEADDSYYLHEEVIWHN